MGRCHTASEGMGHVQACTVAVKPHALQQLHVVLSLPSYRNLIQSLPAMSEEGEKGKGKEKEPLQLDVQALEAIIEGVASKLQEECKGHKPGEHSGSETASSSSGTGGE